MDFGEVLTKAWRIVWKHKVLWIFGIFAGCSSSGGGGGGGSGWQQSGRGDDTFGPQVAGDVQRFFSGLVSWISDNQWIVAVVVLVLLVLMVLAVFIGTIGKIGLIRGAFKADGGADRLEFGSLFRESLPYFWRVLLLSLAVGLAALVIFLPLALFGALTAGVGFLCLLPLVCVMIPVFGVVGIIIQQADAAMVIEDLSITDGVRRSWEVCRKNVGAILIIWLITAVAGFIVGLVIALPLLIIAVPAMIAFLTSHGEFPTAVLTAAGLCFVIYLPLLVVAQGILTAYIESVWALTFLRLTRREEGQGKPQALPANA